MSRARRGPDAPDLPVTSGLLELHPACRLVNRILHNSLSSFENPSTVIYSSNLHTAIYPMGFGVLGKWYHPPQGVGLGISHIQKKSKLFNYFCTHTYNSPRGFEAIATLDTGEQLADLRSPRLHGISAHGALLRGKFEFRPRLASGALEYSSLVFSFLF